MYRRTHAEYANKRRNARRAARPGEHAERVKLYHRRLRAQVMAALGDCCACCGEREPIFLQLDHIGGGGVKHLKRIGSWVGVYREVRDAGFPKDKYRILCSNCNSAIGRYGTCPHEKIAMLEAMLEIPCGVAV